MPVIRLCPMHTAASYYNTAYDRGLPVLSLLLSVVVAVVVVVPR